MLQANKLEIADDLLDDLLLEVADNVDDLVSSVFNIYHDDPSMLYAATIMDEYGYFYFGTDNAFIYALVPDELHPAPWTKCKDMVTQRWSIYDSNNVQVAGGLNDKVNLKMTELRQALNKVNHDN